MVVNNNVWKYSKKHNKIKERAITCSYIWHIISKCAYWLDTLSTKVWWKYMLPNTNATHFSLIEFFETLLQGKKEVTSYLKNPRNRFNPKDIRLIFSLKRNPHYTLKKTHVTFFSITKYPPSEKCFLGRKLIKWKVKESFSWEQCSGCIFQQWTQWWCTLFSFYG